ncbi:MAG: response regulator transcription factor, partial [Vampirovibrio sp.]|nr:response regulator transcription factor [Vampirovibrio sp.]
IVEDYKLFRVGLHSLLEKDPTIRVVGGSETAEEALKEIEQLKPHVVFMDLGLPGMNGIDATQAIKQLDPTIRVIILTSHNTDEEVLAALGAGAHAYCLKEIASERLREVLKSVSDGAAWLDPAIAAVGLKVFQGGSSDLLPNTSKQQNATLSVALTEQEQRVLELLVEGKSNNEIADTLHFSVHTAKVYVSRILEKLSVSDRVQAAVKAVKSGLVE